MLSLFRVFYAFFCLFAFVLPLLVENAFHKTMFTAEKSAEFTWCVEHHLFAHSLGGVYPGVDRFSKIVPIPPPPGAFFPTRGF